MKWNMQELRRPRYSDRRRPLRRAYRPLLERLETRLAPANVDVLTFHNDQFRTGANLREDLLTPANVSSTNFGKLFSYLVDGYVYAQPLYKANLNIGGAVRNVAFVATEHDSVYAFNADSRTGGPDPANPGLLWQHSFVNPVGGVTSVPQLDIISGDIVPEVGITGTPVIDGNTNTLYVVAKTKEIRPNDPLPHYVHRLHALDIATGNVLRSVTLGDTTFMGGSPEDGRLYEHHTTIQVPGTGAERSDSVNGMVSFNSMRQLQRPGLVLSNGVVFVGFASHGDRGPYHGWVIGYDAQSFHQLSMYNTTPNGGLGGIWQSGGAPAVDPQGNLFFSTGNGQFSAGLGGPALLGGGGGSLGYAGGGAQVIVRNSVAVAFRTFPTATALGTNGSIGPNTPMPNIDFNAAAHDTTPHTFRVTLAYGASQVLTETITDLTTRETFSRAVTVDIPGQVGGDMAYVGFTGGTGGLNAHQSVLDWQFTNRQGTVVNHGSGFADSGDLQSNGDASLPGQESPVGTFRNHQDIGNLGDPRLPGSASFSNGTYSVSGSGSDIIGGVDHFQYVYRPLNGDGEIIARVASITNTDFWAKAGIMIRETPAPGSRNVFMVMSPHNESEITWRTTTDGGTSAIEGHTIYPEGSGPIPGWVRLVRHGDMFTGYWSADGVTWNPASTNPVTVPMAHTVLVGLAVTSHNNSAINTTTFDNIRIDGDLTPPVETSALITLAANNQAGSIFTKDQVDVTQFTTNFEFQLRAASTAAIADGLTFTIQRNLRDYGESVVKLSPHPGPRGQLPVLDFFTPFDWRYLNRDDLDLGSGATMLLPDQPGTPQHGPWHLAVEAGKTGRVYLIDRDNMGRFTPRGPDNVLQTVTIGGPGVWASPAFWNNLIFYQGTDAPLRAFQLSNSGPGNTPRISSTPVSQASEVFNFPGAQPSISSDGPFNGIAWSVRTGPFFNSRSPQVLHAYEAVNLAHELYRSDRLDPNLPPEQQPPSQRDQMGGAVKFIVPTVTNGHVFVGALDRLDVFGLFEPTHQPPTAAPSNLVVSRRSSEQDGDTQLDVSWTNNATNVTGIKIFRSTDGSNFTQINTVPRDVTLYHDTGLRPATEYFYYVVATNQVGDSGPSNGGNEATLPPRTVIRVADVGVTQITVSWNATASDHYELERSTNGTMFTTIADNIPASQTSFADNNNGKGLPRGTYFYRVTGVNVVPRLDRVLSRNVAQAVIGPVTINHSDEVGGFTNHNDLILNGNALVAPESPILRLTPAVNGQRGSAFTTQRVGIRGFTTTFMHRVSEGTTPRADGFTFTIQADDRGPTALGDTGGALGYGGAGSIRNSVAIKFDFYKGFPIAPDGDHSSTGLYVDGHFPNNNNPPPDMPVDLADTGINLNSQATFEDTLSYDGTTLHETIRNVTDPEVPVFMHDYTVNIPMWIRSETAYVGFTGGTGGLNANQDILNWTYTEQEENLPPRAPTDLRFTSTTSSSVTIVWNNNNPYTADGVSVERSVDGGPFKEVLRSNDANVNTYVDTDLAPGQYTYRARHFSATLGDSNYSNAAGVIVGPAFIDHSEGFADHSDLTNNGSTTFPTIMGRTVARLTPPANNQTGSIFTNSLVDVSNFTTSFTIQITPGTSTPADGMAFVIQSNSPRALSEGGGGLGYGRDHPDPDFRGIRNSIAVKFDIYNNSGEGDNSTGLFTDGRSPTIREPGLPDDIPDQSISLDGTGINLKNGNPCDVTLTYDGATLTEMIRDTVTGATFSTSYTVDIGRWVGGNLAYLGFTGATGGLNAAHDVRGWTYQSPPPAAAGAHGGAGFSLSDPLAHAVTVSDSAGTLGRYVASSSLGSDAALAAAGLAERPDGPGAVGVAASQPNAARPISGVANARPVTPNRDAHKDTVDQLFLEDPLEVF